MQIFPGLRLIIWMTLGITYAYGMPDDASLKNLNAGAELPSPSAAPATTTMLTVAEKGNLLIATTISNRPAGSKDNLEFQWAAPQQSLCTDSTFPIKAGPNPRHDVFWAYRTLVHNYKGKTFSCSGTWSVQVVNHSTGQTLAQQDYQVSGS